MSDNEHHLLHLISLIDGGDFTVLIGAGASREGRRNGKPLPLYSEFQHDYLARFSPAGLSGDDATLKREFLKLIKEHREDNSIIAQVQLYFSGTPGYAHAMFACIAKILERRKFFLRVLTTNFDDLIERAAKHIFQDVHVFAVPGMRSDESEQIRHYNLVDRHVEGGQMVVAHLFGDKSFTAPIFYPEDHLGKHFHSVSIDRVKNYLSKPTIVIGYSFVDQALASLVAATQAGGNPIYIIDPSDIGVRRLSTTRPIRHIKATFVEFIELLAAKCKTREEFKGGALERMLSRFPGEILFPDRNALAARAGKASATALERAQSRIGATGQDAFDTARIIVERLESGPKYWDFLGSSDKVQLVIGRSGTGKTTLLWQMYNELRADHVCLYYDSVSLDTVAGLGERLAQDFYFPSPERVKFFNHLERVLGADGRLLIFIDGINEARQRPLESIVAEIYQCAQDWPEQVKAIVTCRDVYWDYKVPEPVKAQRACLFLGRADRLDSFSVRETETAYSLYADHFRLHTPITAIAPSTLEKLRHPLMLRMLAEAYQDQAVPSYVPAVRVFRLYRDRLRTRFKGTGAFEFLLHLIEQKVARILAATPGMDPGTEVDDRFDPSESVSGSFTDCLELFVSLADEGVLQEIGDEQYPWGRYYRFIFDQFYEFLLGEAWGRAMRRRGGDRAALLAEQIGLLSRQSPMSQRAVIAELVNQNMSDGVPPHFDFQVRSFARALLWSGDPTVADVARQVLRELIHDAPADFIGSVWGGGDSAEAYEQILEIAGDALRTLPIHVRALTTDAAGDDIHRLRDRAIRLAEHLWRDAFGRDALESALIEEIRTLPALNAQTVRGLVFFSCLLLTKAESNRFGSVAALWRRVLANRRDDFHEIRNLIATVLIDLCRNRGPRFFPSATPRPPFGDYTSIPPAVRSRALRLMAMLTHADRPLGEEDIETIAFFGAEIRDWEELRSDNPDPQPMFYPFEYRIAQWVLLLQSRRDFDDAANYMDKIARHRFSNTLDYALCAMKFALQHIHRGNRELESRGFEFMRGWIDLARSRFSDEFFSPLDAPDPLMRTDNFLSQTARISAQLKPDAPIRFLVDVMRSPDIRDCKLALLSARHVWNAHPVEVLLTLESLEISRDPQLREWRTVTLSEIYGKYPKLVETHLERFSPSLDERVRIRGGSAKASIIDLSYFGDDVFREVFLDDARRLFLAQAYADLIVSDGFEPWARNISLMLLDRILGR